MNRFPFRIMRTADIEELHAQITSALQQWREAEQRIEAVTDQADADRERLNAEVEQWHGAYCTEVLIANRSEEALEAQNAELARLRSTVEEQAAELAALRRMLGGHEEVVGLIEDPDRADGESLRARLALGVLRRLSVRQRALGIRSGPLDLMEQLIFPTPTERVALESGVEPKELE
ncbi:hypothetical protein ABZ569_32335 [Streptomyces albus]|uniref:hypothetical protein n=1 Tax=Streptomyces albus TaxID=1888 RepID=UPI0033EE1531